MKTKKTSLVTIPGVGEFKLGDRVQIPAYTDTWMRGARYGVIAWFDSKSFRAYIRMDNRSVRKLQLVELADCQKWVGSVDHAAMCEQN